MFAFFSRLSTLGGGASLPSDTEQKDDHVRLGRAVDVRLVCIDMENEDNKDCANRPSKKAVEKTISAICCTRHASTAAPSTIWYNEF